MTSLNRILSLLAAVFFALAPAAQASMALPVPCGMPMAAMQNGAHDCCGSSCDCSIKSNALEVSMDLPSSAPRFETLFIAPVLSSSFEQPATMRNWAVLTEESPSNQDPLYELYSDYRL